MKSTKEKALAALTKGPMTSAQIASRYGLENPRHLIYTLRNEGHDIAGDMVKTRKGNVMRYLLIPATKRRKAA